MPTFCVSIADNQSGWLTRLKTKQQSKMPVTEVPDKPEVVLVKMDDLLVTKEQQEAKLNSILQKLESL